MPYWTSVPFAKLLIPYVLGIILSRYINSDGTIFLWSSITILILLHLGLNHLNPSRRTLYSLVVFVAISAVGYQFSFIYNTPNNTAASDIVKKYSGEIADVHTTDAWVRYIIKHVSVIDTLDSSSSAHQVLLRHPNKGAEYAIGDHIIFRGTLSPIRHTQNPLVFDIRSYWSYKRISQEVYVDGPELMLIQRTNSTIHRLQDYIRDQITNRFAHASTKGVAMALLLGDKSALDPAIKNTYMDAGAMHVLAVSGLHVGIVAGILIFCLGFITHFHQHQASKIKCLTIGPIWLFAAVCNFSPSVTRASIMITLLLLSRATGRQYHGLNILSVTALILLFYNPNYVYDVGFQLSFMAVLSLLLVYAPIRDLYRPKNIWISKIWELTSVTIAVQLFIVPILIFYFHRFPIYFIPSSLVAVSSLGVILVAGFISISLGWVPVISDVLIWIFEHLIYLLNSSLQLVHALPKSNIEDLWIDHKEVMLLYLIAMGTTLWLHRKTYRPLWFSVVAFIIFCSYRTYNDIYRQPDNFIVSYMMPYHTGIELVHHNTAHIITSTDSLHPFMISNIHSKYRIKQSQTGDLFSSESDSLLLRHNGLIIMPTQKIIIIDKNNYHFIRSLPPQRIDYLFIHKSIPYDINAIVEHHTIHKIVFDCTSHLLTKIKHPNVLNTCNGGWIKPI